MPRTNLYFARTVKDGAFGKLGGPRQRTLIDEQDGVRWNRDTLCSCGVFDWRRRRCVPVMPGRNYTAKLYRPRQSSSTILDAAGWAIERWAQLDRAAERIDVEFG